MDKNIKKQWLKALRSGEYEQRRGYLHSLDNGYCCLGVLTEVINGPDVWEENLGTETFIAPGKSKNFDQGYCVLRYGDRVKAGLTKVEEKILYSLNDGITDIFYESQKSDRVVPEDRRGRCLTFEEIADWIEEHL